VVVASFVSDEHMGIAAAFLASGTSIGAIAAPLINAALAARYGWQLRAADLLGINRNTLRSKVRGYGLKITRSPISARA